MSYEQWIKMCEAHKEMTVESAASLDMLFSEKYGITALYLSGKSEDKFLYEITDQNKFLQFLLKFG